MYYISYIIHKIVHLALPQDPAITLHTVFLFVTVNGKRVLTSTGPTRDKALSSTSNTPPSPVTTENKIGEMLNWTKT